MLEVKKICQQLDFEPSKSKGQNFLFNDKILDKIIEAADLKLNDTILEIGPGFGVLTEALAQKVKRVVAVELDKKLASFLSKKFSQNKKIEIVQADILKIKNLEANFKNCGYKLVANLPYNITGIVLRKFLSEKPKPSTAVLMIQKEVAQRVLAKNGKHSIISLMVAFYGQPEIVCYVSKNNFWPRPKVDSAVLRITQINEGKENGLTRANEKKFFQLIKTGFASPRKQLIVNLKKIKNRQELEKIFKKIDLDLKVRAEDLSLAKWLEICYNI